MEVLTVHQEVDSVGEDLVVHVVIMVVAKEVSTEDVEHHQVVEHPQVVEHQEDVDVVILKVAIKSEGLRVVLMAALP